MTAASGRVVFRALADADVRFILVGGLAVNVHGFMRFTLDIDIVVKLDTENIIKAFTALASVGYRPVVPVSAVEFADQETREGWVREKHMQVLRFHCDEHFETPVDVFATEPFAFDQEYRVATVRELAGTRGIRVVSLPTLLRMKAAAGRPQDIADLDNLRLRGSDHE